jgi:hypothetical protein
MTSRQATLLLIAGLLGAAPALAQEGTAGTPEASVEPLPHIGNRVDYEIKARYNGETHRLDGEETIRWTNATDVETSELWFHLYYNAFSNNRSTFAVEGSPPHKDGEWGWSRVKSVAVGGQDVTASFEYMHPDTGGKPGYVRLEEGSEPFLLEDDRTVFRVSLPEPVAPGETAEVTLTWTSLVPRVRRRTGYKDEFLLMAQWFPKLGVFEGSEGWNCHQFHPSTEFFSDYGSYRVTLNLPGEYADKVGASGVLVASRKKDGDRVEVEFQAPSAEDQARPDMFRKLPVLHDFTWTGDPKYIAQEFHFSWDEWSAKSEAHAKELEIVRRAVGPDVPLALRDVDVTVLIHPERLSQARRHFEATANALYFYGLWFGEYPYEHITVVDPVWGDNRAGGMEYPTLFTAGTQLYTSPDEYRPESVTVHEAGHQFWYGLVGNNEFESAWLDEGFNSYTDSEVLLRAYGPQRGTTSYSRLSFDGVRPAGLPAGSGLAGVIGARDWSWDFDLFDGIPVLETLAHGKLSPLRTSGAVDWWRDQPFATLSRQWTDPRWQDRSGYLASPDEDPIDTPAWKYVDGGSYRANSYPRPAVALRSMVGLVGYDAFLRGMRHYAETYRYAHPKPEDFFAAFNEGAGVDLSWYFADAFQSTKTIDWSVGVKQSRASKRKGWFQVEDGRFRTIEDIEKEAEELAAEGEAAVESSGGEELTAGEGESSEAEEGERPWLIEITLQRRGELCLPLPIRIEFEGGEVKEFTWSRQEQLKDSWWRLRLEDSRKVKSVVLDPERLYYLDRDMSDNQWYAQGDEVAPLRWTERVLNQYGHLLHWYGGIGG